MAGAAAVVALCNIKISTFAFVHSRCSVYK